MIGFAGLVLLSPALAQELRARPPVLVVEDLIADDWRSARVARTEVARLGASALPALLRARLTAHPRVRGRLDAALREIVHAMAEEVGKPLGAPPPRFSVDGALGGLHGACDRTRPDTRVPVVEPDEFGDLGSISAEDPQDWLAKRLRARRARGALARLGPPITSFLLEVPPLREPLQARMLAWVAQRIYAAERAQVLAAPDVAALEAFQARYAGLADLCVPIVASGVRDPEARVRAVFQTIRDRVLGSALAGIEESDASARVEAEESLLRLGHLAIQPLRRVAAGEDPDHASPQAQAVAARIARRIRFGISRELVRRIGHDMEGYDQLDFRARRSMVFELERLGKEEAVPALRALLQEEQSDEVRVVAAIGLFRQGDALGAEWLALHRSGIPLVRISPHELAAIHMDQGLRYLTHGRFERAEREFKAVIELEPKNEVAWYNLACTYSRWGKVDLAIEHLLRAVEHGFDDVSHMESDRDLDGIREDPRYLELIDSIERRKRGEDGELETEDEPGDEPGDEPSGGER